MFQSLSEANYRRLRPDRPHHIAPDAQPTGATVTLRLEWLAGAKAAPEIVFTDKRRDYTWRVAMHAVEGEGMWSADVLLPSTVTVITYHFVLNGKIFKERRLMESRDTDFGNRPVYSEWEDRPFKIAVYDPARMTPEWTKGIMVYQIFPDRFARKQSDEAVITAMKGVYGHEPIFKAWDDTPEDPPLGRDFFGGDLRGIIEKLDYIRDLGAECIYLNPIFEASSNHRYEAIDFLKIEPMLGTEADFDELIREADARGIKIILDAVFNHCSSDSVYFDITGKFGNGASQSKESPYYRWFKFHDWPHKYDSWIGLGFMPEFVECPEVIDFFLGVDGITEHWLKKGIAGWRADMPFDNTDAFWRQFRERVDAVNPDAWTIGEEWRDSTRYLLGDMFNATMSYRFTWAVRGFFAMDYLTAGELDDRLYALRRDTPPPAIHAQMNALDSHDTDRLLTACGGSRERFKQAFAFLFAYPGAPSVFYGSESGIEGRFPEDSRRPMQWGQSDDDLLGFLTQVANIRKGNDTLRRGDVQTVLIDDDRRLYGIVRRLDGRAVYAIFNAGRRDANVHLPLAEGESGTWHDLLGCMPDMTAVDGALRFVLPGRGYVWLTQ